MTPKDTTPDPVHPAPAPSLVEAVKAALWERARQAENEPDCTPDEAMEKIARAALSVTDPAIERMREEITRLREQVAAKDKALDLFVSFGCPVCNGDCASANPPVMACPMETARAARKGRP